MEGARPGQVEEVQVVRRRGQGRGIDRTTFGVRETTDTYHTPGYESKATEIRYKEK